MRGCRMRYANAIVSLVVLTSLLVPGRFLGRTTYYLRIDGYAHSVLSDPGQNSRACRTAGRGNRPAEPSGPRGTSRSSALAPEVQPVDTCEENTAALEPHVLLLPFAAGAEPRTVCLGPCATPAGILQLHTRLNL